MTVVEILWYGNDEVTILETTHKTIDETIDKVSRQIGAGQQFVALNNRQESMELIRLDKVRKFSIKQETEDAG